MSVPVARRVVVGVDFSAESAAALRWACREASLRGAEVDAVYVRETSCHSVASYAAVPAPGQPDDDDAVVLWRSVMPDQVPGVKVCTEVVEGLAARVLLDRSQGADMLVLGTASDMPGALRSAGPVIRGCLRRAQCPVVVISAAQDPLPRTEAVTHDADTQLPARVPVGAGAGGDVGGAAAPSLAVPAMAAQGVRVPAGACG